MGQNETPSSDHSLASKEFVFTALSHSNMEKRTNHSYTMLVYFYMYRYYHSHSHHNVLCLMDRVVLLFFTDSHSQEGSHGRESRAQWHTTLLCILGLQGINLSFLNTMILNKAATGCHTTLALLGMHM